jgi:hypothetical protein
MAKFLLAAGALISGVAGLYCLNGIFGNVWAAGFHDAYYDVHVNRIYICTALSLVSFGACGGIVFSLRKRLKLSR